MRFFPAFACTALLAATSLTTTALCEDQSYCDDDTYYADPPDPNFGMTPVPKFVPPYIPNPWDIPDHWSPYPYPRIPDTTPPGTRQDVEAEYESGDEPYTYG
jgi:hypothetical protein